MDVPLWVALLLLLLLLADVMSSPGAKMSTHLPQFEK